MGSAEVWVLLHGVALFWCLQIYGLHPPAMHQLHGQLVLLLPWQWHFDCMLRCRPLYIKCTRDAGPAHSLSGQCPWPTHGPWWPHELQLR